MTELNPSSAEFFEAKYRKHPDPWNFTGSAYETSRYQATLDALPRPRYCHAFEPGCSVGVLTERLAARCDHVTAIEFSQTAVNQAAQRCALLPNVSVSCEALDANTPARHPFAQVDLLLLSEIGYYFTAPAWTDTSNALIEPLPTGATVLAVHWLGTSPDHLISGDDVHRILLTHSLLHHTLSKRHQHFRLDRWTRL